MKDVFLQYAQKGAMTLEELAQVLQVKPEYVRRNSMPGGFIPRIPGLRQVRFDPMKMIEVFCEAPAARQPAEAQLRPSSLKTEETQRHKTEAKSKGVRKCLL